jgi:molybdate transport repressor ModE-like protein
MDLQWDDVRYLERIAQLGSVGAAARDLNLSISTLYRRVATLEASLGQLCLVRGPNGGTLTPTGEALAAVGRRTRAGLSEVTGQLRAQATTLEGEVSFTTVSALQPFIERPIAKLAAQAPHLRVVVHLGDAGPSVRRREVDVALGVMHRPSPGCWGRKVARLQSGVYATREALARPERGWVARALAEVSSPESAWERVHAGRIAVRAPFSSLVGLVAAGVGLGLIPRQLAALHPGLVEVSEYKALVADLERPVWLLTHPDLRKTPRVVALMNALEGCLD